MEVIGVAYFQGSHLNYPIPTQKRAFSSISGLTQFRRACLPMFFFRHIASRVTRVANARPPHDASVVGTPIPDRFCRHEYLRLGISPILAIR